MGNKLEKRARLAQRLAGQGQPPAPVEPAPPPERIKVFFCERTGYFACMEHYHCAKCTDYTTTLSVGKFKWEDRPAFPENKTTGCVKCGRKAVLWSQGFPAYYRRLDTGEEIGGTAELLAGACYIYPEGAEFDFGSGPDGRNLMVMLPDGTPWHIDGRANNCSQPLDKKHRCWVRSGSPEAGTLHVDKNGNTCSAGAGSIGTSKYHGFLHNGYLTRI